MNDAVRPEPAYSPLRLLPLIGPGLVVMLADTDAASVLTAAESGRERGCQLLALQLVLIPIMYLAQELSVRVGLTTGRGFLEAVERRFGRAVGVTVAVLLAVSCFGALVTQLCGLAGIGEMVGLPRGPVAFAAAAMLFVIFATHSHRSVERVALLFGGLELAFLVAAWLGRPDAATIAGGFERSLSTDRSYLLLVAASIGTSVMPWTIAYQQSALVVKGLKAGDLASARFDTLLGAIVCQVVTASIVVAFAAHPAPTSLSEGLFSSIPALARVFVPSFGAEVGPALFASALGGAALVATIVVCLTAAWAVCEISGEPNSLDRPIREAPVLYGALALILAVGATTAAVGSDPVALVIDVGAANALSLPIVFALLLAMASDPVCGDHRLRRGNAVAVAFVLMTAAGLGVFAAVAALTPGG